MFKNILLPIDGSDLSEIALDYGIKLSRSYNSEIYLLNVIDIRALEGPLMQDLTASIGAIPFGNYQGQIRDILQERADAILGQAEKKCQAASVKYHKKVSIGVISKEICEEAHKVDLVIMGQRGEHERWATVLLGSTLESVVRSCNKPILITARKPVESVKKILMAYDGRDYANDALKVTASLATEMSLPLVILTVGDDTSYPILKEAEDYIRPYNLDVEFILKDGHPVKRILEIASDKECNLIAMGAFGEGRFKEVILGSTTEAVLRKTELPLLLCR